MKTTLQLGAPLDTLDSGEMQSILAKQAQNWFQQFARGIKWLEFGPVSTTISGSAFTIDGTSGSSLGPRTGFVWSIRRLLITGLGTGTTPDVANFYRNETVGPPIWQLNGNSFGTTFGKGEMILLDGSTLSVKNSGTISATGQVTVSGDVIEVAAEEFFKLI